MIISGINLKNTILFLIILIIAQNISIITCNEYSQLSKLMAKDGSFGDSFGYSLSIHDNNALIGAYYDESNAGQFTIILNRANILISIHIF